MPFGVWIERLGRDEVGPVAFRGSSVMGAVHFGAVFHWIPLALVAADPSLTSVVFAGGAYGVIVVGLSALTGLFGWLLHQTLHRTAAPMWLALPVVWTAFEWTRAHLPDSLALPWLGLGTSLTAVPELVGAAEIVGARGITFWLVAVNALLVTAWVRRSRRAGAVALLAVVLVGSWGFWRAGTLELRTALRVTVVQPDAARGRKVDGRPPRPEETAARLPAVGTGDPEAFAISPGSTDLVVLPELFFRADPTAPESVAAMSVMEDFSGAVDAPVVFGALGSGSYNSAFLLQPDGLADFRYDKHRLVPWVERTPFRQSAQRYEVGEGWPVADVAGVGVGVFVCYESSYPGTSRALGLAGADILVNVTNDAWLGGAGPLRRTVALWQHPAHLVMRAIEGRVGVVRAAATGVSMFVDPLGRTHQTTDIGTRAVRLHEVQTVDGVTVYYRLGDVVGAACAAVALLLLLHLALLGARRGSSLDPQRPRV